MSFNRLLYKSRIIVFGDTSGVAMVLDYISKDHVVGIVGASIRPQYFEGLRKLAEGISVPLYVQPKVTDETYDQFLMDIKGLTPQLILVNSYSMKLHDNLLSIPIKGGINIHAALLPQYRGANPTQWAITNYETETGVTMHEMTSSIDEGGIIDQRKVNLYFSDTYLNVYERLTVATKELIADNLESICEMSWIAHPQDETAAVYRRRRKPEDGQFDWSWSVIDIYNLIRAIVYPLPGAWFINASNEFEKITTYKSLMNVIIMKNQVTNSFEYSFGEIKIRPLNDDNCPEKEQMEADKGLMSFVNFEAFSSVAAYHEWKENILSCQVDCVLFSIEAIPHYDKIGLIQISQFNWKSKSCLIQLYNFEGKSLSAVKIIELILSMSKFSFTELKLDKIRVELLTSQIENIDMYKSMGFEVESKNSQPSNVICMSLKHN